MKLYLAIAKSGTDESPWVQDVTDEWCAEVNGTDDMMAAVRADVGDACEVRLAVIKVPDSFLDDVFKTVVVTGVVPLDVERERCAALCASHSIFPGDIADDCAHAIRRRKGR